jgi:acyl dehydratase
VANGQSTVVTRHVRANLFYRGLAFRRAPVIGDTLRTRTEVVALRQNQPRPERAPTGLAALRITTTDQENRPVLDYWRCAMLPLRDQHAQTAHADDLDRVGRGVPASVFAAPVAGWRLDRLAHRLPGPHPAGLQAGQQFEVTGGDVVSSAPELARLTLNVAAVHHDARAGGGERLVYGGHTIALALSQAARALPALVTVAGWHGCDHLGPVREGDTLRSTITVEQVDYLPEGGGLVHLRSVVRADGDPDRDVLDWRFVVVLA